MEEKTGATIAIGIIATIIAVIVGLYIYNPETKVITPENNGTTVVNPPVVNNTNGTVVTPPVIVNGTGDNGTVIVTPPVINNTENNGTVIVPPPVVNNTGDNGTVIVNPPTTDNGTVTEPDDCNVVVTNPTSSNSKDKPFPDEVTLPYVDNGTDICITDTDPSSS